MVASLHSLLLAFLAPPPDLATRERERGDVPGWVLITLMTAGLVVTLWAVAAPALQTAFETAIQKVVNY